MENTEENETKKGFYSASKVSLAFLIFTLIFVFLTSHNLYVRASNVQNQKLKTILTSILKPIDSFATKLHVNTAFDALRRKVLQTAQLDKMPSWEEFYYGEEEASLETNEEVASAQASEKPDVASGMEEGKSDAGDVNVNEDNGENEQSESGDGVLNTNEEIDQTVATEERAEERSGEGEQREVDEDQSDEEGEEVDQSPYLYDDKRPFRILMVGDSQMYSIANGLKKITAGHEAIEITDFSIQSSGFIRGDYYNWEKKIANIFSEQEMGYYHVAVVLLGMNDYQDIFYGNTYLVRETKGWEERYRDKIVRVMNLLLLHTKKVYWLGMPIVRRGTYNDDLRYIDKVQEAVASEYHHSGLKRVSLANIAPGEGVPFTETIQKEDGQIIRLMKSDGVHYTLAGGEYIMSSFLKDLYAEWYIKPACEKKE